MPSGGASAPVTRLVGALEITRSDQMSACVPGTQKGSWSAPSPHPICVWMHVQVCILGWARLGSSYAKQVWWTLHGLTSQTLGSSVALGGTKWVDFQNADWG